MRMRGRPVGGRYAIRITLEVTRSDVLRVPSGKLNKVVKVEK